MKNKFIVAISILLLALMFVSCKSSECPAYSQNKVIEVVQE
ncbi:MAG TPA: hypothetical protein PKW37_04140 [Salinivirgaceae bacterium]|nr:hypothetical protein [Salinivirgaceae bacterium]